MAMTVHRPRLEITPQPQAEAHPKEDLSIVTITDAKPLKVPFLKRCF